MVPGSALLKLWPARGSGGRCGGCLAYVGRRKHRLKASSLLIGDCSHSVVYVCTKAEPSEPKKNSAIYRNLSAELRQPELKQHFLFFHSPVDIKQRKVKTLPVFLTLMGLSSLQPSELEKIRLIDPAFTLFCPLVLVLVLEVAVTLTLPD